VENLDQNPKVPLICFSVSPRPKRFVDSDGEFSSVGIEIMTLRDTKQKNFREKIELFLKISD
jgi:hypothetical protein